MYKQKKQFIYTHRGDVVGNYDKIEIWKMADVAEVSMLSWWKKSGNA